MSKPLVHYNSMDEITKAEQRKLCRCSILCEKFVIITYTRGPVLSLCAMDARRYIAEVGKAIGLNIKAFHQPKRGWTDEETERIKRHYEKHGGEWGYLKAFAVEIGRSQEQLRQKIWRMKRNGELE